MKKQLFTMVVTLGFAAAIKPAFADDNSDMQKVMAQTTALEAQVQTLNKEINQLKAQKRVKKSQKRQMMKVVPTATNPTVSTGSGKVTTSSPMSYITGTPIVIAPYVGAHTAFDASDLIISYSSYNEDLRLLQLKQHIYGQLPAGQSTLDNSLLMLSGKIEGQGVYSKPYTGGSTSNINLYSAELDVAPIVGDWANGLITFRYGQGVEPNVPPEVVNQTRVHVSKAFLTIGNLDRLPVYATIGQLNVPFGAYTSSMLAFTLPSMIFETKAQAIQLGYENASGQGPYGEVFAFNGDTNTNRNNNINNLGANLGFNLKKDSWNTDFSVSGITNIADSLGMQQTGTNEGFEGFSAATSNASDGEKLLRQVPGVAVHWNYGVGSVSFTSEYIKATSAFAPEDMMFNGHGARPQALNLEANYSFPVYSKPTAFSIGYGKTWESLALAVPEQRYIAAITTSLWKDTIEELEFRHDLNYSYSDIASGAGTYVPADMRGGSSNTVTAQFGVYF